MDFYKNLSILMLSIAVITLSFKNSNLRAQNVRQVEMIKELESDVEDASSIAYGDCRQMMVAERPILRVDGCYRTIEILCKGTKEPSQCFNSLSIVCEEVGRP